MTQADWVKEYQQRWFVKNGELSVETYMEIQDFIQSQITLAQQRTEKKWKNSWQVEVCKRLGVNSLEEYEQAINEIFGLIDTNV